MSSVCCPPGGFALDSALRIPSGVMSTRDRMFARAGLEDVILEAAVCAEGVVGVPLDGRVGLPAKKNVRKMNVFEEESGKIQKIT